MAAKVSPLDRCDADSAERAMVWLYRPSDDLTLAFCGHHYIENACLLGLGFEIVQNRLNELEPTPVPTTV